MRNDYENKENGRSMIEMLGVLAIIGVLSVGGIAGYSKAMHKIRLNKTIEFITHTSQNIRTFFAPQKNYNGLDSYFNPEVVKKAKLVPDNMWGKVFEGTEDEYDGLVGYFGEEITLGYAAADAKGFVINISGFWQHIDIETCIELATYDWKSANSGFVGMNIGTYDSNPLYEACHDPEYVSKISDDGFTYLCAKDWEFPLSLDAAMTACENAMQYGPVITFLFE